MKYFTILILIIMGISCKNDKKTNSVNIYNKLANTQDRKTNTVSEYNTDIAQIENIKRPDKTIFRNLEIDTTRAFGIWTQDPNGPNADFWLTAKSFYVVDYDGNGAMPYILDKNEITVFYNDFVQKGLITSTENDTLKIKWSDNDRETKYVKFETEEDKDENKPYVIAIDTKTFYLNSFNLSKPFSEKNMIEILGNPDKIDKNTDNIEETGFPDYTIEYGANSIWASYGYISDVYIKGLGMKINDVKLGDKRNLIDTKFNIKTESKNYIQLVNHQEESIFLKFDKNEVITDLSYGKLIL